MSDTKAEHIPLQDELPSLIEKLGKPAGDDPRFSSKEAIEENYHAFAELCHVTWKALHERSIDEIMTMEGLLARKRDKALPAGMIWYFERSIQIWRRLNDALIWVLLGFEDHVIRTVCHRKLRPKLASANPNGIRGLLKQLNSDPMTIAIWTDATTCVDIGDVFCKAPDGQPNGFLEVKGGAMNDKILELLQVKGSTEHIADEIEEFVKENGPKALKQLERVIRQQTLYNQMMDIVEKERGFDPRRQAEVFIGESHVALTSYDDELQAVIDAASEGSQLHCIDRCLWVYIDPDRGKSPQQKINEFASEMQKALPETFLWMEQQFDGKLAFEAVPIAGNLYAPEAIPLFLRALTTETIRDLLLGRLMDSAFVFLDWRELAALIQEQGAELSWSTFKEGRREEAKPYGQGVMTIGERVPKIQLKDGRYVDGFSKLYRIYFDGIRPSSIVAQYIEFLHQPIPTSLETELETNDAGGYPNNEVHKT